MKRIFVDMDGVLCEFRHASPSALVKKGYFANLRPQQNVVEAVKILVMLRDVYILSAYIPGTSALAEKMEWADRYIPEIKESQRVFIPVGTNKSVFVNAKEDDVLADDYWPNLYKWEGKAVKILNGINSYNKRWICVSADDPPEIIAEVIMSMSQ